MRKQCKGEKPNMQTSESFRLSAILSLSGGLQDALFFAIGAGAGGILSQVFYVKTIWVSLLLLSAVTIMMIKKKR